MTTATTRRPLTPLEAAIVVAFDTVARELTLGMLEDWIAVIGDRQLHNDGVRRAVRNLAAAGLLQRHVPPGPTHDECDPHEPIRLCPTPHYTLTRRGACRLPAARRITEERHA